MENKAWLRLMALTLVLPLAVACGREEEEVEIDVETEPAATPVAPVTVQILPQGGATVAGDLTAMHEADNTRITLNLTGLTEGKDYEARIRYGTCAVAMNYLDDEPMANDGPDQNAPQTTPGQPGSVADDHEIGEVVEQINLDRTGATATGTGEIDNDDLRADEAAYLVITEDSDEDVLIGCADLSGHGAMGTTPGGMPGAMPGTEPGAAMPSDSAHR